MWQYQRNSISSIIESAAGVMAAVMAAVVCNGWHVICISITYYSHRARAALGAWHHHQLSCTGENCRQLSSAGESLIWRGAGSFSFAALSRNSAIGIENEMKLAKAKWRKKYESSEN